MITFFVLGILVFYVAEKWVDSVFVDDYMFKVIDERRGVKCDGFSGYAYLYYLSEGDALTNESTAEELNVAINVNGISKSLENVGVNYKPVLNGVTYYGSALGRVKVEDGDIVTVVSGIDYGGGKIALADKRHKASLYIYMGLLAVVFIISLLVTGGLINWRAKRTSLDS